MLGKRARAAPQNHVRLAARAIHQPRDETAERMRKIGLKAITAILTAGRRSKRHANWTLSVAIFSTIVTIGLVALYFMQDAPELR